MTPLNKPLTCKMSEVSLRKKKKRPLTKSATQTQNMSKEFKMDSLTEAKDQVRDKEITCCFIDLQSVKVLHNLSQIKPQKGHNSAVIDQ